jgi:hypothetical protein
LQGAGKGIDAQRRHAGILGLAVLCIAGCVTAYDPSTPARLTMDTRAEEVGTKEARPPTKIAAEGAVRVKV